jgi:general secretion pathway protein G
MSLNSSVKNLSIKQAGFSLMELIVVMVIIGILASITGVAVRSNLIAAKKNAARAEIAEIVKGLESHYADQGRYPTNAEGIAALTKPTDNYPEGFMTKVPSDPWKRPYVYRNPGARKSYDVICLGEDGKEGGTGAAADLRNE